jgi:hypothetical protein
MAQLITDDSKVVARAHMAIAQNSPINGTTAIFFDTIDFDSHGAISNAGNTSFRFTAPMNGVYRVTVVMTTTGTTTNNMEVNTTLMKNGVLYSQIFRSRLPSTAIGTPYLTYSSDLIKLNKDEYVYITGNSSTSLAFDLASSPSSNYICIERL